jgi:hypothetical protein
VPKEFAACIPFGGNLSDEIHAERGAHDIFNCRARRQVFVPLWNRWFQPIAFGAG